MQGINDLEAKTATPSQYQMRCPSCQKLYSVQSSAYHASALPRFQCQDCRTRFYAFAPALPNVAFLETHFDEGGPTQSSLEMEARSTEPSDATSELVEGASAQSKSRVAVQPAPLRSQTAVARDLEVSRSLDLVGLWSAIVADYNNEILHERFVTACERGRALHFAAMKYQAVLDAAPTEPIALKMKTRVTGMVSQLFATSTVAAPSKFKFPSATKLLVFLGSFAIVAGLIAPQTGLAGVGISMLALAIGLRLTAS